MLRAGDIVGERFEIEREAGAGAMGTVYRAIDRASSASVALKVLRGEADAARFARESKLLAGLAHPAIVRYIAHGQSEDGRPYLAMEWLEGRSLAARLADGPLEVSAAVACVERVASALGMAHALGVVHRDVKPENLFLVGGDPALVKVLDFGVARVDGASGTRTGVVLGTPAYMAPEQARGERQIDARVDVFALGCVLFECLTGRPAFSGAHVMAILARVLLEDAPRVANVPSALGDLVAALLTKDPAGRPRDGAQVAHALAGLAAGAAAATGAALTQRERRVASVVFARWGAAPAQADAMAMGTAPTRDLETARRVASACGADLEVLVDGSVVALTDGPDQAAKAARCALRLREALPDATIVVATGRGAVGGAGGEALDRAASLAVELSPHIRVDENAASLLERDFELAYGPDGPHLVADRAAGASGRPLLGKRTPFVGRERELSSLEASFCESATESLARAVVVLAPPGTGKSRLADEFRARLAQRGTAPRTITLRCDPLSGDAPLAAAARLTAALAGLVDSSSAAERLAALRAHLGTLLAGEEFAQTAAYLARLLGLGDDGVQGRDLLTIGARLRTAFLTHLRAEVTAGPLLIVADDLQWADAASVGMFDSALGELTALPLFLLVLARPALDERFPRLFAGRDAQTIRLRELTPRAAEALVRAALDEPRPEVVARVVARAAGNAFFLEELIRAEAAGKGDATPATVLALAESRLDRLPANERRALRAASVIGETFWTGAVAELSGETHAQAERWIANLVEAEVVSRAAVSRFGDEPELLFRHALVRDAAYATLTDADRRLGHRLAAGWLARRETEPLVVARHHEHSGDAALAAEAFLSAGEQALRRSQFAAALDHVMRATLLDPSTEHGGRYLVARGRATQGLLRSAEARPLLEAALPFFEGAALAELYADLVATSYMAQDVPRTSAIVPRALELARAEKRPDLESVILGFDVMNQCASGKLVTALRLLQTHLERNPGYHRAYAHAAQMFVFAGRYDEGVALAERLLPDARAANDYPALLMMLNVIGHGRCARGRHADALIPLREAEALGRRHGVHALLARTLAVMGGVHIEAGDLEGGETFAREAIAIARASKFLPAEVSATLDLCLVAIRSGRLDEASRLADELAGPIACGDVWHGWLWRLRLLAAQAELALARGDGAACERFTEDIFGTPDEKQRPRYVTIALILRGRARHMLGRTDEARADLDRALAEARTARTPGLFLRAATSLLDLEENAALRAEVAETSARVQNLEDGSALRAPDRA